MKARSRIWKLLFGGLAMAVLILDAETALRGASEALELCIRSVIPALFPFLVCAAYLTGNLGGITLPFLGPLGRLCRIPSGLEGILLTGLLGGYPTGAQAVVQAFEAGQISMEDAHRMLGFCSNAGPAFIFGMLSPYFSGVETLFLLWAIHILSALAVGILLPGGCGEAVKPIHTPGTTLPQVLGRSVRTMGLICGWIVVFRMAILFLERWFLWLLPAWAGVLFGGITELTNGCVRLENIDNEAVRFLLASVFLSAGGLCVGMQTLSVTGKTGTGMYFPGKAIQTCISGALCGFVVPFIYPGSSFPWLVPVCLTILASVLYCLQIRKNNSSIFRFQGV